jgi:diguanylate cyclase (GGDEF)-like protein
LTALEQGQADVHIAYPQNGKLDEKFLRAWEIYGVNSQLFVSKKYAPIHSAVQLKGKNIGVLNTAPYLQNIVRQYPEFKIRYFSSIADMVNAGLQGKLQAFIASFDNSNDYLNRHNLSTEFYALASPVFYSSIFSLVNKDNDALAKIIRNGFADISPVEYKLIEKKWLSNNPDAYYASIDQRIALTEREREFLARHPNIKVGVLNDWAPMEFIDEQGVVQGINPDVINLLTRRSGLSPSFIPFKNWQQLFQALTNKEIDLVAGVTENEERKQSVDFTKPYWTLPWVILHKSSLEPVSSMKDFDGQKLAVVKGYSMINDIVNRYPNIQLQVVDETSQGIRAVEQGVVAGFVENIAVASELLKKESLTSMKLTTIDSLEAEPGTIAVRKDWPLLVTILNKAIDSVGEKDRQAIIERWFTLKINTGLDKAMVLKVTAQLAVFIIVVISFIIIWNRRLHVEVKRRRKLEEKMKFMATHDELTGLANRMLLRERLQTAISYHQRQDKKLAVMFIDLDGFKQVNDGFGHDMGDKLLMILADRLESCVRDSDTVARFGGDEFIILLTNLDSRDEVVYIANKLLASLAKPVHLLQQKIDISASIGIAMYPDNGESDGELLKVADTLMYQVKASGKNNFVFTL